MSKYTIIIYAIIVGAAVLSSVLKKRKKAIGNVQVNREKPVTSEFEKSKEAQPKTLEDILKGLLNEQKMVPANNPKPDQTLVHSDKQDYKSATFSDEGSLELMEEEKYYGYDTELSFDDETKDYDEVADHHVHGAGFDVVNQDLEDEEVGEWAEIDWKKAIVSAEILRRPDY
jgi:hypothetical protein